MDKKLLEVWASYVLNRKVTAKEAGEAAGFGRTQYSRHSRDGTLPLESIERACRYWAAEAAELGVELNPTDAMIEMGYLPAPSTGFTTATRKEVESERMNRAQTELNLGEFG